MQDSENVRRENTELIAHLWKWHWRIEAICETMGVPGGTATLARVRGALGALAPVHKEDMEDDAEDDAGDLRGATGVIVGVVAVLPFWCLFACEMM